MHLSLSAKLGRLQTLFSAPVRDYFSRLDAAGLRVGKYDLANAALIDRLVGNGGNFWPDSGAFNAMAGYLYPGNGEDLIPLKDGHDAGTLNAFVSGDWNAVTGLKGDGSTKYVDSNRAADVEGQNDMAIGVLPTVALTTGRALIGVDPTRIDFIVSLSFLQTGNRGGSTTIVVNTAGYSKYSANSRALSTEYNRYFNGTLDTVPISSSTPVSSNFYVFAKNDGGPTNHIDGRNAFYHIGPNLSGTGELAELDAALTEWKNALASA